MITGVTRGAGGISLGKHLANEANNERVVTLEGRGLIALTIEEQVKELTRVSSHVRTRTPLYHVHVDPPADHPWTEEERKRYWSKFEDEFGFEDRPFAAVLHCKNGRQHEHRVYLRVCSDGKGIDVGHDFARIERLNREFEFERGERINLGSHSRSVLRKLEADGRQQVADAMRAVGAETLSRPRAMISPKERAQQERTGVSVVSLALSVLSAWRVSDSGESFRIALLHSGVTIFQGEKVAVVADEKGCAHSLARLLAKAAKAEGHEQIRAADVKARLIGLSLPEFIPGNSEHNFSATADLIETASKALPLRETASAIAPPDELQPRSGIKEVGDQNNLFGRRAASSTSIEMKDPFGNLKTAFSSPSNYSQEIWNEYKGNIEARAEALEPGRCEEHPGRAGTGRKEALHFGSKWTESRQLCSATSRQNGGFAYVATRTLGASPRGRDGQNRRDDHAVRADYREPGDLARTHARSRIQNFRMRRALVWQTNGQHSSRTRPEDKEVIDTVCHFGIAVLQTADSKEEWENRRSRWLAAALRRAYDLNWVPALVVSNIADITVDRERRAVVLTLHSGACLVDRYTRIDIVGTADDITVSELVAAVKRRGWNSVRLYGDDNFKRAAAAQLRNLDPPILVQADLPAKDDHASSYHPRF